VNRPDTRRKLGKTPGLAPKTLARVGDELLRALAVASDDRSEYVPPKKPSESQKAVLKQMQKQVSDTAEE
ncbi:MAG: hypothetical protein GWN47_01050, partial [Woeseiaceae bacterium]|nr:hypothetical protein [Woeseiaceae bacterium]